MGSGGGEATLDLTAPLTTELYLLMAALAEGNQGAEGVAEEGGPGVVEVVDAGGPARTELADYTLGLVDTDPDVVPELTIQVLIVRGVSHAP